MQENSSVEQTGSIESTTQTTSPESNIQAAESPQESSNQAMQEAIAELEKMERFKFEGREWTPEDLKAAIMRYKDYTKKTQALAKERESVESERKFYENLSFDIQAVLSNPSLVGKFLEVYPEKFHKYLKEAFQKTPGQSTGQRDQSAGTPDVELLSRLQKLEKTLHDQEVAKQESYIDTQVEKLSKKYPNALPKVVLASIHDKYLRGEELTEEDWERAFEESEKEMTELLAKRYGEKVKAQGKANEKARDVEAGGGTPSSAPKKITSFKEAREAAIKAATASGGKRVELQRPVLNN